MMAWLNLVAVPLLARICLVILFPFSGLDKIINRKEALAQASSSFLPGGPLLLLLAIAIEFVTPVMIVFGWHDRLGAIVLAGFCGVTAVLYHQFWSYGDFWSPGKSQAREHFWEFLKNFGLVGGLLLVVIGAQWASASSLIERPLSSAPFSATADPSSGGLP